MRGSVSGDKRGPPVRGLVAPRRRPARPGLDPRGRIGFNVTVGDVDRRRGTEGATSEPPARRVVHRHSRALAAVIALLGAILVVVGLAFLVAGGGRSAYDRILAVLFVGAPGVLLGGVALAQGWLVLRASVGVGEDGLRGVVPRAWAGGCAPPLRRLRVGWGEIRRLTRARVEYRWLGIPYTVPEYRIETDRGGWVLVRAFCPDPEALLGVVSERTGLPVEDRGFLRGRALPLPGASGT